MSSRRASISHARYTGAQILPTTRMRVAEIIQKMVKRFDLADARIENRVLDALVPRIAKVDLKALVDWLIEQPLVELASEDFDHVLMLATTAGRAGVITASIKAKYGVSASQYLVLDWLVPPVDQVDLEELYRQMYPSEKTLPNSSAFVTETA